MYELITPLSTKFVKFELIFKLESADSITNINEQYTKPFTNPSKNPNMRLNIVNPHFFVIIFKIANKSRYIIFMMIKIPINKIIFTIIFDNIGANISPQVNSPSKVIFCDKILITIKVAIFKLFGRLLNNSSILPNSPVIKPSKELSIALYNILYIFPPTNDGVIFPASQ